MKMSRRAKRMERHHKRNRSKAALNLISLMDIFTILVFFLLINSGDVQVLPNAKALSLPESTAEQKPRETLVMMVNEQEILVQGRRIVDLSSDLADGLIIPALQAELNQHAARAQQSVLEDFEGRITIMGDREIPFELLKRVMTTCAQSGYPQISLAVLKRIQQTEPGAGT